MMLHSLVFDIVGDGTYTMAGPELWSPFVDVRDVASANIKARLADIMA